MKLTDEMVEKIAAEAFKADYRPGYDPAYVQLSQECVIRRAITAYHKILSSTEPDEDMVTDVRAAIIEQDDGHEDARPPFDSMARAAIRAIFGGE